MTEQEIITYLKENRNIGVAFVFMPREVRKWCEDNLLRTDIPFRKMVRDSLGYSWSKLNYDESFYCEYVYCLADDYEPKPEFKPHWEEFQIDKDGLFVEEQVNTHVSPKVYHWWQWTKFLSDNDDKYNNFGGWVYEEPISDDKKAELLVTSPRILKRGRGLTSCLLFNNGKNEAESAYPTKILFWRYKE